MEFKFGRLPALIPAGLRELPFYAAGNLPAPPAKVGVPSIPVQGDGTPWGVLGNDQYGDCGPAGLDHLFMADALITAEDAAGFPSRDDVVQYYLTYTGGKDSGVVLSDYLKYVRANQFFGHTVAAYAPVSVSDVRTLHFAVNAYGGAYAGITVTDAMMEAFDAGRPWTLLDLFSPVAGGHCVPVVGYDSSHLYAVTWGKVQAISYAAWHYIADEAWAVITGEFVAKNSDGRGISLDALNADLSKVAK